MPLPLQAQEECLGSYLAMRKAYPFTLLKTQQSAVQQGLSWGASSSFTDSDKGALSVLLTSSQIMNAFKSEQH